MIRNIVLSVFYTSILLWIYDVEFTVYWRYMRFDGHLDVNTAVTAYALTIILSLLLPTVKSARGYILIILHYLFFLPSVVYLSFNYYPTDYIIALAISASFCYVASLARFPGVKLPTLKRGVLLGLIFLAIGLALGSQVWFGGLGTFNLNPEEVYLYREQAAAELPAFFGYVFSNVANVLIPSSIALALHIRSKQLAIVGLLSSVFLFSMTHHKAIIFSALLVFGLYIALQKFQRLSSVALIPISLVLICAVEVGYYTYLAPEREVGLLTSYIVRRALLVPPMLDVAAVDLFREVEKYYWSTSRLGFGMASNPHGVPAPFLVAIYFFNDPSMSANSGNIASGYANAGLIGVLIYSLLTGAIISFVNMIGERIGHSMAAAISTPVILNVLTSTDFTTALLTHGLFMLLVILLFIPEEELAASAFAARRV